MRLLFHIFLFFRFLFRESVSLGLQVDLLPEGVVSRQRADSALEDAVGHDVLVDVPGVAEMQGVSVKIDEMKWEFVTLSKVKLSLLISSSIRC